MERMIKLEQPHDNKKKIEVETLQTYAMSVDGMKRYPYAKVIKYLNTGNVCVEIAVGIKTHDGRYLSTNKIRFSPNEWENYRKAFLNLFSVSKEELFKGMDTTQKPSPYRRKVRDFSKS